MAAVSVSAYPRPCEPSEVCDAIIAARPGDNPSTRRLPLGYFGASTGAAAALVAAAGDPGTVAAVVSRGGRPDLAMLWLPQVKAPTLLIVGENDEPLLQWNRDALARLSIEKALVVVPGATHLFEEPGALEEAARHACRCFVRHLSSAGAHAGAKTTR